MATKAAVEDFDVEKLCEFLSSSGDLSEGAVDAFRSNRITGLTFFELNETDLKELLPLMGDRKAVQRTLKSLQPSERPETFQALPSTSSSWAASCIPDTFSRRTRIGIEKGVLTKGQRVEIIEVVAYRALAHTEYPTSADYNAICQALVAKYPNIKDTIGNGYGSWKQQLRNKFKNMRRRDCPSSESASKEKEPNTTNSTTDEADAGAGTSNEDDEVSYEENVRRLEEEYKKQKVSSKTVREIMKSTCKGRRKWIMDEAPSVSDITQKFPPLKRVKYLERELLVLTNMTESWAPEAASERWSTFAMKLGVFASFESRNNKKLRDMVLAHQSEGASFPPESEALEMLKALQSLEILTLLMAPRAKLDLIHRFPMNSDIDEEVREVSNNHGYLGVAIADTSVQVFIISERCVLGSTGKEGLLTGLLGAYFTFNMVYPKPLYPVFIFLQHFVLRIVDSQSVPDIVKRIVGSLDRIEV